MAENQKRGQVFTRIPMKQAVALKKVADSERRSVSAQVAVIIDEYLKARK